VALNLAQLVARASHSRFSRRNVSLVVPYGVVSFINVVVCLSFAYLRASLHLQK
jgi:hypothetical protein